MGRMSGVSGPGSSGEEAVVGGGADVQTVDVAPSPLMSRALPMILAPCRRILLGSPSRNAHVPL